MYTIGAVACCINDLEGSSAALKYSAAFAAQFHADLILIRSVLPQFVAAGLSPLNLQRYDSFDPKNADVVVMDSSKLTDLVQFDSEVYRIFEASIPVLCISDRSTISASPVFFARATPTRILCVVDCNCNNSRTIDTAISLARSFQTKTFFLELSHEQRMPGESSCDLAHISGLLIPEFEDWYVALPFSYTCDPADEILHIIDRNKIDLMILRLASFDRRTPYCLSAKIAMTASCPVLLVPEY